MYAAKSSSVQLTGSILDLIFSNCGAFCDVVEAYWTDHKLVYCAIDREIIR